MTVALEIEKRNIDWIRHTEEASRFVIEKPTQDDAFATYFREYANRYKYCNDIRHSIVDEEQNKAYADWICEAENYANNGGDMA